MKSLSKFSSPGTPDQVIRIFGKSSTQFHFIFLFCCFFFPGENSEWTRLIYTAIFTLMKIVVDEVE